MKNCLLVLGLLLLAVSCARDGKIEIRTESTEVEGQKLIHFWCESDAKLYDYRWSITGLDTVFSKNSEADFYFSKSGIYIIELRAIGLRAHKDFLAIRVKGIEGSLYAWWGINGGHRYDISLWAKGTKEDGSLHQDSVYVSYRAPAIFQSAPCLANGVKLNLPAGNYRYYYQYRSNPSSTTFVRDSADCVIDGNCIQVF